MSDCFPFHQLLLKEKKSFAEILQTFPHFASFNGRLIDEAFYRLCPGVSHQLEFSPVLARALLLASEMFLNVEDAHVRGTLRIFATLQKKGVKTLSSNQAGPSSPMQAERILVSPLLRWSQDLVQDDDNHLGDTYIACEAALFKSGPYRIIHKGVVLAKNNSFIGTLDLFWKIFPVFGESVPIRLQMFYDVFTILVYKTARQSSRKSVNILCTNIQQAIEAEGTIQGTTHS
nr:uncharacterized protein LOC109398264 [Aedes albopictus]